MRIRIASLGIRRLALCFFAAVTATGAENAGNLTSVSGTIADPTGAVIPGATVTMHNPVSQFERSTTTDATGNFNFQNVPFNPYHLSVDAHGFAAYAEDIDVRSSVPLNLKISLQLAGANSVVTVEAAGDLLETDSTGAYGRGQAADFRRVLPLESASSSVSSLVSLSHRRAWWPIQTGSFIGLGDHAENSL